MIVTPPLMPSAFLLLNLQYSAQLWTPPVTYSDFRVSADDRYGLCNTGGHFPLILTRVTHAVVETGGIHAAGAFLRLG
jgi:hypothetical protein